MESEKSLYQKIKDRLFGEEDQEETAPPVATVAPPTVATKLTSPAPEKPATVMEAAKLPLAPMPKPAAAPRPAKPEKVSDVRSLIAELGQVKTELDAPQQKAFEQRRKELASDLAEAQKLYEEQKGRTETAELISLLGRAATQLGAGLYGMKSGLDMSGVKFSPVDWSQSYDRARADYKDKLGLIKQSQEELGREEAAAARGAAKQTDLAKQVLVRDFFEKRRAQQKEVERASKEAGTSDRAAQKLQALQQRYNAIYEQAKNDAAMLEDAPAKDKKKIIARIGNNLAKIPGYNSEQFQAEIKKAEEGDVSWFATWFGEKDTPFHEGVLKYISAGQQAMNNTYGQPETPPGPSEAADNSQAPYGPRVKQGDTVFVWDGTRYVEE